ncbi:hypothetical protein [Deinococcus multiflagellatus]|uniref:Outer membrane protein beta-barrel domain-containing protein n=1 Tax=Deinococcus multiflagellatus TaxID=1656887 RepID=A0ABW1ZJ90_9DEIO
MGAGLGLTSGLVRNSGTTNATDVYANVLLGADYRVTDSISVFVEGNGRYYFSNKGAATGLPATGANNGGFSGGVKAGLKFYF